VCFPVSEVPLYREGRETWRRVAQERPEENQGRDRPSEPIELTIEHVFSPGVEALDQEHDLPHRVGELLVAGMGLCAVVSRGGLVFEAHSLLHHPA